jgi:acetyl-CoA C-acetyltransferase
MGVVVSGTGMTRFGELWGEGVESMARRAGMEALEEAKLKVDEIDLLVVGNMLLPMLESRAQVGAVVAEALNYSGPTMRVEGACASGGLAVRAALMAIKSLEAKKVLVVGVEKMTDVDSATITRALMAAGSEEEQWAGATFPSLYALMHQAYQKEFRLTDEEMAMVPVSAHKRAMSNPLAQFRKEITVEQVMKSALVADPIRQLHCAPITDGAAALVLSAEASRNKRQETNVEIIGSGQGGDTLSLAKRKSLTSLQATKDALKNTLFQVPGAKYQVSVAEVHDCFSVAQLMAVRDLGLTKNTVINPSGGLKACGHPVGATGVKQIVSVTRYLREHEGLGLTHNVGGSGATAVVHLLRSNHAD